MLRIRRGDRRSMTAASISWPGAADCSAAQPGAVRSPIILVCGADLVERASGGHTSDKAQLKTHLAFNL